MTYPKLNGRPMDAKRRRDFNALRKSFARELKRVGDIQKSPTTAGFRATAAWNLAFLAVTL